jgi:hypothetical protein
MVIRTFCNGHNIVFNSKKKADFKTNENFLISNGLHLLIEFIERSQINGKIVESFSNHIGVDYFDES